MMFKKIIDIYHKTHASPQIHCGKTVELMTVKAGCNTTITGY
jgi:hypothetical protein